MANRAKISLYNLPHDWFEFGENIRVPSSVYTGLIGHDETVTIRTYTDEWYTYQIKLKNWGGVMRYYCYRAGVGSTTICSWDLDSDWTTDDYVTINRDPGYPLTIEIEEYESGFQPPFKSYHLLEIGGSNGGNGSGPYDDLPGIEGVDWEWGKQSPTFTVKKMMAASNSRIWIEDI